MKIQILHTGQVCVSPYLPFGDGAGLLRAAGVTTPKAKRLWLPVSCYLIEHPKGRILVDTGWHREMSPNGVFDRKAQVRALGSPLLYFVNQGVVPPGQAADEQLAAMGLQPCDIDYLLLTHLDCDHASGLQALRGAKHILVARQELDYCNRHSLVRFQKKWWQGVPLEPFDWNTDGGPFGNAYDLFGDGTVRLVDIHGHAKGLFAVQVQGKDGFVLLVSDGGYAPRSWEQLNLPGISLDRKAQLASLRWIKAQSQRPDCMACLANHDPAVQPGVLEF